ncbi:TauD/TfdA family dioxygenase [Amycolatopsis sp. cmx-4-61]|uniref:TauD/TfdA family dioxygenase n=1 Tax=Amycolatopsis sp. cmx-4-61 TaxID=2790937 RepID=UPI003979C0B0
MRGTLSDDLAVLGPLGGELIGGNGTRLVEYDGPREALSVVPWAHEHRDALRTALGEYGAVRVRGAVDTPELLEEVTRALGGELLAYTERTTPRTSVHGNVYTSTEYPAAQTIPQHNELSYARVVPRWLFFACAVPAASGGATPLADGAAVLSRLPRDLVARFREQGVRYTRAYRVGMGLTWQEAFQTRDRGEVEDYCSRNGLEWEWGGDDELRTRSHRPAVVTDPVSGREVWFNQAHLFHISNLPDDVGAALVAMYEERDYPRHAYHGDGTPITADELALIRRAYADSLFETPWHSGDLMVVDNLLVSHGRRPYTGQRRVLVTMAGAVEIGSGDDDR